MDLNFSAMVWVHTILCVYAMWVGGFVLFGRKGDAVHRARGWRYVIAMIGANGTALLLNVSEWLNIFHWMAIVTLASVLISYAAVRLRPFWGWLGLHLSAMLFSYYMLWGGLINELFLHVPYLHALPMITQRGLIAELQTALMGISLCVVLYFWWQSRRIGKLRARLAKKTATEMSTMTAL
jgi:uncharacterized membrane protein